MSMENPHGIESVASPRDFSSTVKKLDEVLRGKGLSIFCKIDFSGDAQRAGLQMPATQMLIFGNPAAGTPVMLAAPTSALDLPLKILVSQDAAGKVWLRYNAPEYLAERHSLPPALVKNIAGIRALAQAAVA